MSFSTRYVRQIHAKSFVQSKRDAVDPDHPHVYFLAIYHYTTSQKELDTLFDRMTTDMQKKFPLSLSLQQDSILSVTQDGWVHRNLTFLADQPTRWYAGADEGDYDAALRYVSNY